MKPILRTFSLLCAAASFALIPVSCTEEDSEVHDHAEHEHAEHEHAEHDHAEDDHEETDDHDHGDHDHDHAGIEDGPNGGRLLTTVEPHLEFLVTEDRKVQISSITEDGEVQPIAKQSVKVIGGERSNPTRMKFEKQGDVLVSDIAFPQGNDFPVVVQIQPTADGDTVTEKFNLNLEDCPTCDNLEYACTCDHAH